MPVCKQKLCLWLLLPVLSGCAHSDRGELRDPVATLPPAEIETFDIGGYFEETMDGLGFPFTSPGTTGGLRADTPIRRSREDGN